MDFGELGWLKDYLEFWFDHTMLLPPDDPLLDHFERLEKMGACSLRIMHTGVGMEGTAEQVCTDVDKRLRLETKGRCWVVSVEARENDKNSAVYYNPEPGFRGWT